MSLIRSRIFSFISIRCLGCRNSLRKHFSFSPAFASIMPSYRNDVNTFGGEERFKILSNYNSKRFLAKKSSKKAATLAKPKVVLDDEDMEKVYDYEELQAEIEIILEDFKQNLKENFNARLTPRQIEGIPINYEGMDVTIADLITVTRKQNDIYLNLQPLPHMVKPVMKALIESGLNLNPQVDGHVIFIQMNKVTTEYRQGLMKSIQQLAQKTKEQMKDKNLHRKFEKSTGKFSKDLVRDAQANLDYFIKQKFQIIDEISESKIELLSKN